MQGLNFMLCPHCGAYGSALTDSVCRPDVVPSCLGRHDKSFSIVHLKGLKRCTRAFHDCFFSFDKIQHMYASGSVMLHGRSKPMPSGLDELQFMQSGSLLDPARALAYLLDTIQ